MSIFKQRGGAQIGWVNASWPLAGIEVGVGSLTVTSMGRYVFSPADVSAVEEVGSIPFLTQGIRIHHTKAAYPEKVVFYSVTGRRALVAAIRDAGFRIGEPVAKVSRGFPLRVPSVAAVFLVWNLLFFLDNPNFERPSALPGPFVFLALASLFGLATFLPRSTRLQAIFMREDREVGEISSLLRLVQVVSGIILLGFTFAHVSQ